METHWKEVAIGAGLALTIALGLWGIDITPIAVIAGLAVLLHLTLTGRLAKGGKLETLSLDATSPERSMVTFDDIGGQESAKRELLEALEFVSNREKCVQLGIRPLKGILMVGPPGTGKTLLAKAAASFTDAAFVATSGSSFIEMYAGVGAQRVRKIFAMARQAATAQGKASAIIFIDEIEVVGGKRGRHSSHLEYDQTLNQLLVEMDGINIDLQPSVLVVGATNRPDLLDQALVRPGRFDRVVRVELPDKKGRLHILRIHARNKPLASGVDLEKVAAETFGFSGAHLESLLNEAAIHALRRDKVLIEEEDIREAMEKIMLGERLDRKPLEEERRRVAYHETGHALVSEILRAGSVSSLTVTPRGQALGYMRQAPEGDRYLYSKEQLLDQIAIALGGAVLEEMVFGSRSTGSRGDFEQAVEAAEQLIYSGMSELGVVSKQHVRSQDIDGEVRSIIGHQEARVREFLGAYQDVIEPLAEELLRQEKLSGTRFRELMAS
ncbi:MAG: AAA family ATPase [Firmicutes bacterium]|nr:AAA family ATPase [Bacillota bacterium]